MDELDDEVTQSDLDFEQTREHAVEITGYLEAYCPGDFLLVYRGLKLLLSIPRFSIITKHSFQVCYRILETVETQPLENDSRELHSDIILYCAVRRLCFELLFSLDFEQGKEWFEWSERLLRIIKSNEFDESLQSMRAQSLLLSHFLVYGVQNKSSKSQKGMIRSLRKARDIVSDNVERLQKHVASLQNDLASYESQLQLLEFERRHTLVHIQFFR
jgi:hypothetical protein